jgi:anti-sigma factor ChrR (cupin superfamily)
MKLNADFATPAFVAPDADKWVASPMPGVERLMLDRIGDEHARATSIVRYAAESRFSEHMHDRGEEYIVLEGTFSDAAGDHAPMTYVRNPHGTRHAPWSEDGCVIFVKLRQFQPGDDKQFAIATADAEWRYAGQGISDLKLHEFGNEGVSFVRLEAGAGLSLEHDHEGAELFVLDGEIDHQDRPFGRWSWLRFPPNGEAKITARSTTTLYVKTGHLAAPVGID